MQCQNKCYYQWKGVNMWEKLIIRWEPGQISMAYIHSINATCTEKITFEINGIWYQVQVLTTQMNDRSRYTNEKNYAARTCEDTLNFKMSRIQMLIAKSKARFYTSWFDKIDQWMGNIPLIQSVLGLIFQNSEEFYRVCKSIHMQVHPSIFQTYPWSRVIS